MLCHDWCVTLIQPEMNLPESDTSLLLLRGTSLKHPTKSAKTKKRVDIDANVARRNSNEAQLHGLASKDRTSPLVPVANSSLRHMADETKSEDFVDAPSAATPKSKRPSSVRIDSNNYQSETVARMTTPSKSAFLQICCCVDTT